MARGKQTALIIDLSSQSEFRKSRKKFQRTRRYFDSQHDFLRTMKKDVQKKFIRPMVKELKEYPGTRQHPEDYPIKFTSGKQRRYVMRLLNNKPYQRRGILRNGFRSRVVIRNQQLRLRVENTVPHSKYVIGKIGIGKSRRSTDRYVKPLQQFHKETGWSPAYEVVQKYYDEMVEYVKEQAEEWYMNGFEQ